MQTSFNRLQILHSIRKYLLLPDLSLALQPSLLQLHCRHYSILRPQLRLQTVNKQSLCDPLPPLGGKTMEMPPSKYHYY